MNWKLIFFDIDGTILTADNLLPPSAAAAIRSARSRGHLCVVNTGRPYSHIEPAVKAIGFDGYICSCGQHILMEDVCVLHDGLSPQVCRQIVEIVRKCRLDVIFEGENGIWFDYTRPQREEIRISAAHFAQRGFDVHQAIDAPGFHCDKFCVWCNPDSDVEGFLSFIRPHCSVIHRGNDLIELVKLGHSKETGLRWVMERTGIALDDCYAIGDSANDLPMLHCVPHSIAMGNAPVSVQQSVEYVTAPIDQDGLARALLHYGLASPDILKE